VRQALAAEAAGATAARALLRDSGSVEPRVSASGRRRGPPGGAAVGSAPPPTKCHVCGHGAHAPYSACPEAAAAAAAADAGAAPTAALVPGGPLAQCGGCGKGFHGPCLATAGVEAASAAAAAAAYSAEIATRVAGEGGEASAPPPPPPPAVVSPVSFGAHGAAQPWPPSPSADVEAACPRAWSCGRCADRMAGAGGRLVSAARRALDAAAARDAAATAALAAEEARAAERAAREEQRAADRAERERAREDQRALQREATREAAAARAAAVARAAAAAAAAAAAEDDEAAAHAAEREAALARFVAASLDAALERAGDGADISLLPTAQELANLEAGAGFVFYPAASATAAAAKVGEEHVKSEGGDEQQQRQQSRPPLPPAPPLPVALADQRIPLQRLRERAERAERELALARARAAGPPPAPVVAPPLSPAKSRALADALAVSEFLTVMGPSLGLPPVDTAALVAAVGAPLDRAMPQTHYLEPLGDDGAGNKLFRAPAVADAPPAASAAAAASLPLPPCPHTQSGLGVLADAYLALLGNVVLDLLSVPHESGAATRARARRWARALDAADGGACWPEVLRRYLAASRAGSAVALFPGAAAACGSPSPKEVREKLFGKEDAGGWGAEEGKSETEPCGGGGGDNQSPSSSGPLSAKDVALLSDDEAAALLAAALDAAVPWHAVPTPLHFRALALLCDDVLDGAAARAVLGQRVDVICGRVAAPSRGEPDDRTLRGELLGTDRNGSSWRGPAAARNVVFEEVGCSLEEAREPFAPASAWRKLSTRAQLDALAAGLTPRVPCERALLSSLHEARRPSDDGQEAGIDAEIAVGEGLEGPAAMPPGAPFAADVLAAAEQVRRMRGSPRLGAALASPSSAENNKQREDAEVLRSARAMLQDLARRFAGRQHVQPEEALFAAPGCSEGDGGGRLSVVALAASAAMLEAALARLGSGLPRGARDRYVEPWLALRRDEDLKNGEGGEGEDTGREASPTPTAGAEAVEGELEPRLPFLGPLPPNAGPPRPGGDRAYFEAQQQLQLQGVVQAQAAEAAAAAAQAQAAAAAVPADAAAATTADVAAAAAAPAAVPAAAPAAAAVPHPRSAAALPFGLDGPPNPLVLASDVERLAPLGLLPSAMAPSAREIGMMMANEEEDDDEDEDDRRGSANGGGVGGDRPSSYYNGGSARGGGGGDGDAALTAARLRAFDEIDNTDDDSGLGSKARFALWRSGRERAAWLRDLARCGPSATALCYSVAVLSDRASVVERGLRRSDAKGQRAGAAARAGGGTFTSGPPPSSSAAAGRAAAFAAAYPVDMSALPGGPSPGGGGGGGGIGPEDYSGLGKRVRKSALQGTDFVSFGDEDDDDDELGGGGRGRGRGWGRGRGRGRGGGRGRGEPRKRPATKRPKKGEQ